MATTKKSSQTNKRTSKKKSTKRKSPVKKGKVYIAPYKIIVLCAAIIAFCMILMLATTLLSSPSPKSKENQNSLTERFTKSESKSKTETPKETKELKKPYSEAAKKSDNKSEQKSSGSSAANTSNKTQTKTNKPAEQKTDKKSESTAQKPEKPAETTQKTITPKKEEPVKKTETKTESKTDSKIQQSKQVPPAVTPKSDSGSKNSEEFQNKKPENTEATPKPSKDTVKKSDFGFPVAKNGAQLIFVFDDGGQNLSHLESFMSLPFPFTVAVLPQLAHSAQSAERVRKSGNEVILHQPMQSVNPKVNPGPGAITPDMTEDQIKTVLFQNINQIAPIAGLNNHEGSAITADAEKMAVVLQLSAEQSIYFLDSRTNVETKVPYVAGEMGYSYYERNIFLDNEKSKENTLKELNKGLALANKNGSVIMIGHIWSADYLPELLKEFYPELKAKGYTFSVVSKSKARKN